MTSEIICLQAVEGLQIALRGMSKTIKLPQVWKPSLYMYLSLALSISTHEGHFYWYTDPKAGPAFSQVHATFYKLLISNPLTCLGIVHHLNHS
jgi:hypothetical protein